jgi:hypothetical protein
MTAGGRRGPRPLRRGWGETVTNIPPAAPPEGIDLVIAKMRADREIVRDPVEEERERRRQQGDLDDLADDLGKLAKPERDHLGRVVVDRNHALLGALIVAVVVGVAFFAVWLTVNAPPPP